MKSRYQGEKEKYKMINDADTLRDTLEKYKMICKEMFSNENNVFVETYNRTNKSAFLFQIENILKSVDLPNYKFKEKDIVFTDGKIQPNSTFFHVLSTDIKKQIDKILTDTKKLAKAIDFYGLNEYYTFKIDEISNKSISSADDSDYVDMTKLNQLVKEYEDIKKLYNEAYNYICSGNKDFIFKNQFNITFLSWIKQMVDIMDYTKINKINAYNCDTDKDDKDGFSINSGIIIEKNNDAWYMWILKNQYYDKDLRFKICSIDRYNKKIDIIGPNDFDGNVAMFKAYMFLQFSEDSKIFEDSLNGQIQEQIKMMKNHMNSLAKDNHNGIKDDIDYEK